MGLGLFFARRIARGLGGDITAAPGVQKGTGFTVRVPLGAGVRPRTWSLANGGGVTGHGN